MHVCVGRAGGGGGGGGGGDCGVFRQSLFYPLLASMLYMMNLHVHVYTCTCVCTLYVTL